MKLPAVWIAFAFAAGIAAEKLQQDSALIWAASAAAAILLGAVLLQRRHAVAAWIFVLATWTALGGLAARIEGLAVAPSHVSRMIAGGQLDTSEPLRWRGRLRSDPLQLPWGLRYEIDLGEVEIAGRAVPVTGGLRVSYFRNAKSSEEAPELRAGDWVEALVRARRPRDFLDPGAFDVRGHLARQGIDLTASLRSTELLRKLGAPPLTISYRLARLRGRLLDRLDQLFAETPERAAVLRAMLLGDRSFVDSDLAVTFQKTAAYHVLVVAGLHVAALAMFVFWLGRRLRFSLPATTVITLLVLAGYVGVVQDRPPILRAALMAAVFLCSRLLFRRVELLNTVAVAALLLLVARPSWLFDASFQLSFLAASVIAGLSLPWIERSSGPYRAGLAHLDDVTRDSAHPPRVIQFRLDLRAVSQWLAAHLPAKLAPRAASFISAPFSTALRLWEVVVLSATIQLGMLPMLARYFHRVSLSGPASNIPAVLLTALIVPLGFLALGFSFLWMRLGVLFGRFLGWLVAALLTTMDWIARWPHASYRIPGPPASLLIPFFAVLALLAALARAQKQPSPLVLQRLEWLAAAVLAALALLVVTYPFAAALEKGKLEVTVLDVGQGDSIFAAFPGGRTMLIDGGGQYGESRIGGYRTSLDVGEEVVSQYLWRRGLKRVDVVALTHAHHDHLDGLNAVLDNFGVHELWLGRNVDSAAFRSLIRHAQGRGVKVVHRIRGATFSWDGVTGIVLWPADASEVKAASNDDSLVLRLEDGRVGFLLTGDIEHGVEEELVRDGDPLAAEFLKVPHHGSRTSSTAQFVAAIAPRVAVISAGEGNPFGQPNSGVVERYKEQNTRLLETSRDGAVTAITDGLTLSIHTYAESHPNRSAIHPPNPKPKKGS